MTINVKLCISIFIANFFEKWAYVTIGYTYTYTLIYGIFIDLLRSLINSKTYAHLEIMNFTLNIVNF